MANSGRSRQTMKGPCQCVKTYAAWYYLCNRRQNWHQLTPRSLRASSKTRRLPSSRNWRASSPLSCAPATPAIKHTPRAAQAELKTWLTEARASGVPAMETFAAGLEGDSGAISAALTPPWSNGQTEGQVNRLKLIKRQMFGHASFDLLRRRVLLAA